MTTPAACMQPGTQRGACAGAPSESFTAARRTSPSRCSSVAAVYSGGGAVADGAAAAAAALVPRAASCQRAAQQLTPSRSNVVRSNVDQGPVGAAIPLGSEQRGIHGRVQSTTSACVCRGSRGGRPR